MVNAVEVYPIITVTVSGCPVSGSHNGVVLERWSGGSWSTVSGGSLGDPNSWSGCQKVYSGHDNDNQYHDTCDVGKMWRVRSAAGGAYGEAATAGYAFTCAEASGGDITLALTLSYTGGTNQAGPCVEQTYTVNYTNGTPNSRFITVLNTSSGRVATQRQVQPYSTLPVTFTRICTNGVLETENFKMFTGNDDPLASVSQYDEKTYDLTVNPQGVTETVSNGLYDPTKNMGKTNITFTDTADAARDSTLKTGFQALRETTVEGLNALSSMSRESQAQLIAGNAKADAANTALAQVNSSLASLSSTAVATKNSVDGLAGNIGNILTKATSIDIGISGLSGKLDTGNGSLASIDTKAGQINSGISTGNGKLDAITTALGPLSGMSTKLDTINTSVSALNVTEGNAASAAHTDVGAIISGLNAVSGAVGNVTSAVNSFSDRQHGDATTGNGSLASIDGKLTTANGHLATIAGQTNIDSRPNIDSFHDSFKSWTNRAKVMIEGEGASLVSANHTLGEAAAAATKENLDGLASGLGQATFGGGSGSLLQLDVPTGGTLGTVHFDLDPANHAQLSILCSIIRALITALLGWWFCRKVWGTTQAHMLALGHIQQGRGLVVSAGGFSEGGLITGLGYAGILTVCMAFLPAACISILLAHGWSSLQSAIVAAFGSSSIGATILYLLNCVLPLNAMLSLGASLLIFSIGITAIYWVCCIVARWMIASVIIGATLGLANTLEARSVTICNQAGTTMNVYTGTNGEFYAVAPGRNEIELSDGDYYIATAQFGPSLALVVNPNVGKSDMKATLWTDSNGAFYMTLERVASNVEWFLEGFGLGLGFMGFALVLRIQRGIARPSPEL